MNQASSSPLKTLTAIVLLAVGSFVLLSGCVRQAGLALFTTRAAEVERAAATIADFNLPPGYTADFSASLFGYTLAAFNPGDDRSHIYLFQMQGASGQADLERGLERSLDWMLPGSRDRTTRMTVIENRSLTIRSQVVTVVISESTNSQNRVYRQLMAAFDGKGGPALLVLSEPPARWDEAVIQDFLDSIQ